MDAGPLNQRIAIYEDVGTDRSALNQHITAFTPWLECWAAVDQLQSNEVTYDSGQVVVDYFAIAIRHNPDKIPTTGMRVHWNGRIINLTSVVVRTDKTAVFMRGNG